jgi:hypothetical protein
MKANEYESCHNCLVDSAIALLVVMDKQSDLND